ncbi:MAG: TIGR03905 family TSCPD domain-containing protein [Erysipelotrichaceae bacterium]|nr:TIGR03905 family TSCPD domain-containing protein [Erysipelotrichaceae bacterium]
MEFIYKPHGVCSTKMTFEIDGETIRGLTVENGCNGNLKGIAKLISGRSVDEVIEALKGTTCGYKNTSCPDQIARALEAYRQTLQK